MKRMMQWLRTALLVSATVGFGTHERRPEDEERGGEDNHPGGIQASGGHED